MKLSCTKENLKKAIFSVEKISNKQISLPILKNVMLKTKEGKLFLYATNLEIGVSYNIRAKVVDEGEFSVPVRLLSDFVNNLPDKNSNIEIELKESSYLDIVSGEYRVKIKGVSCDDFPIIPKPTKESIVSIDGLLLKNTITKVLSCVSNSDMRVEFMGVNLVFEEDGVFFASTNGFKLAESRIKIKNSEIDADEVEKLSDKSVIIPVEALIELNRVIGVEGVKIGILIEDNQIFFNVNNEAQIVSKLINGKYPDYKQVIPDEFVTELVVNKDELLRAIRIANVFTSNKSKEVVLSINVDEQILLIESEFQDLGENEVELSLIKISGQDQNIVLNPQFIIDGLNLINSTEVLILLNSDSAPVAFRGVVDNKVDESYIYITMPVKK